MSRVKRHAAQFFAGRRAEQHGITGKKPTSFIERLLDSMWGAAQIPKPRKPKRHKTLRRRFKVRMVGPAGQTMSMIRSRKP